MEHKELAQLDKAFLNSMLAYGVYKANRWLQPHSVQQVPEQVTFRKSYERMLKKFNTQVFEPVLLEMDSSGVLKSKFYETKFTSQLGYYSAWDGLAGAIVFESQVNNEKTLHIAFRGTDVNSKKLRDFVSYAYFDMQEFYQSFKPFEKAIWKHVNSNQIKHIQVSGHSLGGAMVQEFFNSEEAKNSAIELEGFTYGAPSSTKSSIHHIICNVGHKLAHKSFMEMVKASSTLFKKGNEIYSTKEIDSRISQYKHHEDVIPQAGSIFYKPSGIHILLKDSCQEMEEGFTVFKSMLNNHNKLLMRRIDNKVKTILKYHDMLRYTINLEYLSLEFLKKDSTLSDFMPYLKIFNEIKSVPTEVKTFNF